jgi:hypothetical protein
MFLAMDNVLESGRRAVEVSDVLGGWKKLVCPLKLWRMGTL